MEVIDLRDEIPGTRSQPSEDLLPVHLYSNEDERHLQIGTLFDQEMKLTLIDLLTQYKHIFAWTLANMPSINL